MHFNRFDICGAYWLYYSRYHGGQNSHGYHKLSQLAKIGYIPGTLLQIGIFETENQKQIYRNLLVRERGR